MHTLLLYIDLRCPGDDLHLISLSSVFLLFVAVAADSVLMYPHISVVGHMLNKRVLINWHTLTDYVIISCSCGLWGCKNRSHSVSWPEVIKGLPNQAVDCFVSYGSFFSVSLLCFWCTWCFVSLFLVVSNSAIDCLERLFSEMTYYVSSGTLNPTRST